MAYRPEEFLKVTRTEAYALSTRLGVDVAALGDWDADLLREPRVCVPIDVQALVVTGDDGQDGVRLTGALTPGHGVAADSDAETKRAALVGPPPFADPKPRARGIHLHWAMPDALLRGRATDATPSARSLGLPPLPDRFAVTRILVPVKGTRALTRTWIIDALTATVTEVGGTVQPAAEPTRLLTAAELDGVAGGTVTWAAAYDAAQGRFTFHDPQDDLREDPELAGALPGSAYGGRATYLVVGWWSDSDLDPLDGIRSTSARERRLDQLGWALTRGAPKPSADAPGDSIGATLAGVAYEHRVQFVAAAGSAGILFDGAVGDAQYRPPQTPPRPEASTLVHGAVVGVPVLGDGVDARVAQGETRPDPQGVVVALGASLHDAIGALTARSLTADATAAQHELIEELMAAFTQNQLNELDDPAGAAELDAAIHAAGFETVASPAPGIEDRVVDGKVPARGGGRRIGTAPGPGPKFDTLPVVDKAEMYFATDARKKHLFGVGDVAQTIASVRAHTPGVSGYAKATPDLPLHAEEQPAYLHRLADRQRTAAPSAAQAAAPKSRTEVRPDPVYYTASDPYVLVRGAGRSRRHGGDGMWLTGGRLKVRTPDAIADGYADTLPGSAVLTALPTGAVPAETTALAREALMLSDFATRWLAQRAAERSAGGRVSATVRRAYEHRFAAEALLRFSDDGAYRGEATPVSAKRAAADPRVEREVTRGLHGSSLLTGSEPSPVGITAWSQPWCPLWLEYRVEVIGATSPGGWELGTTDLLAPPEPVEQVLASAVSRVPLTTGAAHALGVSIEAYLAAEAERDAKRIGAIDDDLAGALFDLQKLAQAADLLGASLDGVRRRLLGLPERGFRAADAAGIPQPERPVADPVLLAAGRVRVVGLRLVDTFGRVLPIDPAPAHVPTRLDAGPAAMLRPPRLTPPARVRVRFVGAEATGIDGAVDARIDEADPGRQVSPVCGFLLPDHVDESIEVLGPDATPLGELLVTGAAGATGGGVVWEPAPGRPVPADAAPSTGLLPDEHVLGRIATGLVRADAVARDGRRASPAAESALSALLRAVDTTLWTVDATAGAGSAQVASIVGAPLAVVRAVLSVDVLDDAATLALDEAARAARADAYGALLRTGIPVRLGELTRPDDGLVAWFADDDYEHVHLVDKAIAEAAAPAGPGRGLLQQWGVSGDVTVASPIEHPYVSAESEIVVHPGVPRMLTLLMLPGAAVHVTSGIVPRGRVQLQRGWFAAALDALVPSVRVGPVLIDPGDVRLPLVAALGEHQTLTVREGPTAWRNDAILAATQSAALPDRATVLREGWVRVTPGEGADRR